MFLFHIFGVMFGQYSRGLFGVEKQFIHFAKNLQIDGRALVDARQLHGWAQQLHRIPERSLGADLRQVYQCLVVDVNAFRLGSDSQNLRQNK